MTTGSDLARAATTAPPRGTRPRNRRDITLVAATKLFHERGYANVSMSDIAAATNVGASAIYRHFPGKRELLVATIRFGLAPYIEMLEAAPPDIGLEELARRLAACALAHRSLGVLWQREARNLDEPLRRPLRAELGIISRFISAHLMTTRPDLDDAQADTLSWCIMGALVSTGFHSAPLPSDRFIDLLADLALTIAAVTFPTESEFDDESPHEVHAPSSSRRDSLIDEATELFAERGFPAAGIDDIGDAVGIAGPSVYRHFPSKQDLLVAVVERGTEALRLATENVLEADLDGASRLAGLVDVYVQSIIQNRFAIRILISEMSELPPAEREESRRGQRQYVDTWVALLQQVTAADAASARIRTQAILLVVNDAVQTPHLRVQPGFRATINRVAQALLGLGDPIAGS